MASKRRKRRWMKRLHKWPSLVIALFIILWAISGIILNHRGTFSSFDVDRELLPSEHQYKDWNNAAIRGAIDIDSARAWFYGNIGVWERNIYSGDWLDRRAGLPQGADHHKVNILIQTLDSKVFCGTRFGLYQYDDASTSWNIMEIPHHDKHVVDLLEIDDKLIVMTRSHLWRVTMGGELTFSMIKIPAPVGYDNKVGLFKTLWVIHSGEIYGQAGKLIVDAVAGIFVFLTISGLIYFFFPRVIRKRKRKGKDVKRIAFWNKWSIKWHNKVGIWLVAILILTTFTGMFLRPPLLIAIASGRVDKIPFSVLDDGNPWYDQLRRIIYDENNNVLLLATSEGIFAADSEFNKAPEFIYPQPPASVMGYNVFTIEDGKVLVGSFSGIFSWDLNTGMINDHISGMPQSGFAGRGRPTSNNMITGYYKDPFNREFLFDYNRGALSLHHNSAFDPMPHIIKELKMPLWNFALELHTARLFKPFMGDLYILFIPLFGLSTLLILISGIVLWLRKYRRQKQH